MAWPFLQLLFLAHSVDFLLLLFFAHGVAFLLLLLNMKILSRNGPFNNSTNSTSSPNFLFDNKAELQMPKLQIHRIALTPLIKGSHFAEFKKNFNYEAKKTIGNS
eukprot:GHVP01048873.1.p1 GENE.GHVP01048873.1~~GHVP01048873.1.p1  ORF type:complete len:105 (+),score=13.89 GHVP01048873.1:95-409(+)